MHPCDDRLRLTWKAVRYGIQSVERSRDKRRQVLGWIRRMRREFPDSPFLLTWREILLDRDEESKSLIEGTPEFSDLPENRRGWWRQLAHAHPFVSIIPGRTADERRAFLSRHP